MSTSASFAVRGYFMPMRIAGAQARRVLIDAAAAKWKVPVGELTTEPSVVVHKKSEPPHPLRRARQVRQGPGRTAEDRRSDLKKPHSFRLIGKDFDRVDVPVKVNGTAKYGIDVQVPGMVYAAVLQCADRAARKPRGQRRRGARKSRASPTCLRCRAALA